MVLDPDFVELVEPRSYHVFLTTYGPTQLFVESRGAEGFEVATPSSDQPGDVSFAYRVVARRRGAPGRRLERSDPFERELPEQPTPPAAPATPTAPAGVREFDDR